MFVAGGDKVVGELLESSLKVEHLFAVQQWIDERGEILERKKLSAVAVSVMELRKLSFQEEPDRVLAVAHMPDQPVLLPISGWALALDRIRDPGNLGTLIRTADWFGVSALLLSPDCADSYNPKVVQSAMGSLFRMPFFRDDLETLFRKAALPVYAADAGGKDWRGVEWPESGILVIGSESHGVAPNLREQAQNVLSIPGSGRVESLNAAVAAGILLSAALGYR